jgi:hypothetical protein
VKRRLGRIAPHLFIVLAGAAAIYTISGRRDELAAALDQLEPLALLASVLFGMLGAGASFMLWCQVLLGLRAAPSRSESFHVFFVSQLGKYLPGSVWPVVAQMEFGKKTGTGRRTMLAANALSLALSVAVGLIVGAALLPLASASALRTFGWFFLFLPFLLRCCTPEYPGSARLALQADRQAAPGAATALVGHAAGSGLGVLELGPARAAPLQL